MTALAEMIGLAPEGAIIVFPTLVLGLVLLALGLHWLGFIVILLAVAAGGFFRDPERSPARTEGVVLSGADGKVTDISQCSLPDDRETNYHRVSVFMSPLDVHVNRAPAGGEITAVVYTPGQFRAAFGERAGEENERNLIVIRDASGRRHGLMQVAGMLARRIVCRVRAYDKVTAGQRIGLIMFGSRVDHFISPEYRVTVTLGERVRAGETVLGELTS